MVTWASTIARDLSNRARQPNVGINDERLWTHMADSFRRQYADTQEKERAEDILQRGIKMKGEDLDAYIACYDNVYANDDR